MSELEILQAQKIQNRHFQQYYALYNIWTLLRLSTTENEYSHDVPLTGPQPFTEARSSGRSCSIFSVLWDHRSNGIKFWVQLKSDLVRRGLLYWEYILTELHI